MPVKAGHRKDTDRQLPDRLDPEVLRDKDVLALLGQEGERRPAFLRAQVVVARDKIP